MTLKVAGRGEIPPFIVMDVMRAAAEREISGADVLHLEVGQPGTGAPSGVIETVKDAVEKHLLGYTLAFGMPELQQRISDHYRDMYNCIVPVDRIAVTTGSSGAFVLSFLAAFDPGDRVALASPGYPAYRNILTAVGVEVVDILTGPDSNFQPTPEILAAQIAASGQLDGLIIASPSNPTGTMITPVKLKALVEYCRNNNIRLVSDEIYHGITFGVQAETVANLCADAIVINSFSKYFAMTGWRVGWMIVPEDLCRAVECLAQNLFISPPALSQIAAIAAFDCFDELDANVDRYAVNRKLLLDELPKAGFDKLASADGAFYIYADVSEMTNDSTEFCRRMLAETGVAATPGTDFDPTRGHGYVRFSFAREYSMISDAAQRLKGWNK